MTLKLTTIGAETIDSIGCVTAFLRGKDNQQVTVNVPMSWEQLNTTHWAEIERQAIGAAKALTGHA